MIITIFLICICIASWIFINTICKYYNKKSSIVNTISILNAILNIKRGNLWYNKKDPQIFITIKHVDKKQVIIKRGDSNDFCITKDMLLKQYKPYVHEKAIPIKNETWICSNNMEIEVTDYDIGIVLINKDKSIDLHTFHNQYKFKHTP